MPLCQQQHDAITSQMPAVRTRLLVGSDNVERWGEKRIWDAVLSGVRVAVSPFAVLSEALEHGFMSMDRLALLIFDEGIIIQEAQVKKLTRGESTQLHGQTLRE